MTRLDVVKFEPLHAWAVVPKGVYSDEGELRTALLAEHERKTSHIFTVKDCDTVYAIFGSRAMRPGVFELWGITSKDAGLRPLAFHRATLKMLESFEEEFAAHRFQASVKASYDVGSRWLKALGFEREGTMRKYGPKGDDYYLYARVT